MSRIGRIRQGRGKGWWKRENRGEIKETGKWETEKMAEEDEEEEEKGKKEKRENNKRR